jgi:hypothetical protein
VELRSELKINLEMVAEKLAAVKQAAEEMAAEKQVAVEQDLTAEKLVAAELGSLKNLLVDKMIYDNLVSEYQNLCLPGMSIHTVRELQKKILQAGEKIGLPPTLPNARR